MSYHDLSFLEIVCCPENENRLKEMESWLYSDEEGDFLYPRLCKTAVMQPQIDTFLKAEVMWIFRAMAEYGEDEECRDWFLKRYGRFGGGDPSPLDSEILGEGYPGFWDLLSLPQFVKDLEFQTAEGVVMDLVGNHHPQLGLDLGCGQGGMLQRMAANCRQVVGLEKNFYLAATANHLLPRSEIPIQYFDPMKGMCHATLEKKPVNNAYAVCGDVNQMPFVEPLFDWVHCGHFLDLVDNPEWVLQNILRVMKPGATLSICTPWDFEEEGHFQELLEILDSEFETVEQIDGIPYVRFNHKRRFVLHEDWVWVGKLRPTKI